MINNTLKMILDRFAMAYLDDIAIYSETLEKHIVHVKQVLKALANKSLRLKSSKYKFHKEKIEYLGYIVGREGIKMNPEKIQKILKWLILITVKEVFNLIKLANFNRQFIINYSEMAKPLIKLI